VNGTATVNSTATVNLIKTKCTHINNNILCSIKFNDERIRFVVVIVRYSAISKYDIILRVYPPKLVLSRSNHGLFLFHFIFLPSSLMNW
jgi:hypothetical protein